MKILKKLTVTALAVVMCFGFISVASARTYVHGYTKKNGTHVAPHYRSDRDHSFSNNWSTKGNRNPITGKYGTKTHR
ncbi:hypothetical protein [Paenibacillus polymyxa]|uniref:hypothetical protein n=1 Tax=Paenibacillus polymyxa TaxID=1406 RepID=UPI001C56AA93|nr:hypothetical protein [Paenibacillus polymyxa]MCJ1219621.1 hypothetical protein [Paenibacillus polymyxa]MDN4081945.1 hypothetical protein [Paenibacillus polymyxa]MDN4087822.1 hypothetical protein [Paenibacillus polymyxa]MDN4107276.1 hypothetical protein [Paenibacillus polymyxa]URJ34390.1 hypothetical protein MF625_003675 [Paenibacillus polymyxa]